MRFLHHRYCHIVVDEAQDLRAAHWKMLRSAGKVNPTIMVHDCCGRCRAGRSCLGAAQRNYDGPGGFAHNYFEVSLRPGICDVCNEPPEAHQWEFDFHHGERQPRP